MRWIIGFSTVLVLLAAALFLAERNGVVAPVGAQSILYFVADSERDLTRMPSRFTRISDADEAKYGDALAASIVAGSKMSPDDRVIERYLVSIGARIAPHVHRRLRMQVHYIADRGLFNAFAIPGGHLFVGAGLIEQMKTEDQLAAVLAHEMEHVDHYHCAERLQVEAALRKIPLGFIVAIPVEVFQAGYSKEQELEADREGVLLAARSGYSARGAVEMFELLARLEGDVDRAAHTPQEELAQITLGALTGYFRSHPLTPERIAQVKAMIARQPELAASAQRPIGLAHVWLTWRAKDAIELERFDKAAELARRALSTDPDYPPAFVVLAESEYGRGGMEPARNAHRAAIAGNPNADVELQKWIAERAGLLSSRQLHAQVVVLLRNDLVWQDAPVLQTLMNAQLALRDTAAATATAAGLRLRFPAAAEPLAVQIEKDASTLLDQGEFERASAAAAVARALKPGFSDATRTLAAAEFAQAHFAEAASLLLDMYDPEAADAGWAQAFADAAAGARLSNASQQLATLIQSRPPKALSTAAVKVELTGLALLAGDEGLRRELQPWIDDGSVTPDLLGRLCWWNVRTSRSNDALDLMRMHGSYGSRDLQNSAAWAMLESADPEAATAPGDASAASMLQNSMEIRQVLASWQQSHSREAVDMWAKATEHKRQWRNDAWRSALYPPRINALARELEAQRLQRGSSSATGR